MSRLNAKAFAFLLCVAVFFNWKIVLTDQFSLVTSYEAVSQAYCWFNFWVRSVQSGHWPVWDPFTFSGHSFVGEMQTGVFYPVNFLLALFPMQPGGMFSLALFHWLYVITQACGAFLMFRLVREFRLSTFAALVAGICFAFGGVEGRAASWPHFFQSFIWLPLLLLFLTRALRTWELPRALLYASLSGLCLAMTILAGGLHVAFMDGAVVVSAIIFYKLSGEQGPQGSWHRSAVIAGVVLVIAMCAGAVQLLPSIEYSQLAFRFLGPVKIPASERIPYAYMRDGFIPNTLLALVFANASEAWGPGEVMNPYLGVFPLLAAIVGAWKRWDVPWVRYMTGLAVGAFIYAMGTFSFAHGLLYALTPELWMAREANRFMYLADFSLAVLAAYGIDAMFLRTNGQTWNGFLRALKWIAIACGAALVATAYTGVPAAKPWNGLSLLLILGSVWLAGSIVRGASGLGSGGMWTRVLVVGLIVSDLGSFDWSASNEIQERARKSEELDRLLSCRGAVEFLRSRPGPFRVQVLGERPPNIGDLFGVEEMWGGGVTLLQDYERTRGHEDRWNTRYVLRPSSATETGAVYADRDWKVYESPNALPRAWMVHEAIVGAVDDFDARRVAMLSAPVTGKLEKMREGAMEQVSLDGYEARAPRVRVRAASRALLVFSESFYPGWRATVNRRASEILRVDGGLRGVVVPAGDSQVSMVYAPVTIWAGGWMTLVTFGGVTGVWFRIRRKVPVV